MIDFRALWGTAIVHAAGTLMAASPYAYPASLCPCELPNRPSTGFAMIRPGCPESVEVESEAFPDFPLAGADRPFLWLDPGGMDPQICVLVGRDGRVDEAFIAASSGALRADAELLETARGLRFVPASRAGRPVATWLRLIVLRSEALTLWRPSRDPQRAAAPDLVS